MASELHVETCGDRRVFQSLTRHESTLPWVFTDVDGTLIEPGRELSERNRQAILRYTQAGGHITLATGRHILAVRPLIDQLKLEAPQITGNGSVVTERGRDRLLFGIVEQSQQAVAALLARDVPHILYTVRGLYTRSPIVTDYHVKVLVSYFKDYHPTWGDPPDPHTAFKILTFVEEGCEDMELRVRGLAQELGLKSVRTGPDFLDLIPARGGKGAAMSLLGREVGWPPELTVAVGDSENDLSMLQSAARRYAMANASKAVLAAAAEVLPSCSDDGFAVLIDRLLPS